MVGYLYGTVSFPVPSYRLDWGILNLIQHTYGTNHITNELNRNELEFTYEFIGNFPGKIGKLLTTTQHNNPPSHEKVKSIATTCRGASVETVYCHDIFRGNKEKIVYC
jgi:hypothetical protein